MFSIRPKSIQPVADARLCTFLHTAIEIVEMLTQMLERKAKDKDAFHLLGGQVSRQTLAPKRSHLCRAIVERQIDSFKRRRTAPPTQSRGGLTQVVADRPADACKHWLEQHPKRLGKWRLGGPSEHDEVVAQPQQGP